MNANHTGMRFPVEKACSGKAGEERKAKARGRLTIRSAVVLTRYLIVRYSAGIVTRRLSNRACEVARLVALVRDFRIEKAEIEVRYFPSPSHAQVSEKS